MVLNIVCLVYIFSSLYMYKLPGDGGTILTILLFLVTILADLVALSGCLWRGSKKG